MPAPAFRMLFRLSCVAVLCLPTASAQAFGTRTHAWLAERAVAEISRDCRLEIAGRRYAVSTESCAAIRSAPGAFVAGATGNSHFPDPVSARITLRQGVAGGWSSGEWLRQLVQKADNPAALAFALGTVFQAGQEVFANSYINAFAGGPFSWSASDTVLQRHVAIERYLDAHLPASDAPPIGAQIPLPFLRSAWLEDDAVLAQYRQLPAAAHLLAMHDLAATLEASRRDMDSVRVMAEDMLAYYSAMPLTQEDLRTEFGSVIALQKMQRLAAEKQAAANEARWLNAKAMATRRSNELARSSEALQQLDTERAALQQRLQQQEKKLATLPAQDSRQDCRNVRKWINAREWTSNRVCQSVPVANPAHARARSARNALHRQLLALDEKFQVAVAHKQLADMQLAEMQPLLQQADSARQRHVNAGLEADSLSQLLALRADAMQSLRQLLARLGEVARLQQQWQAGIVAAEDDFLRLALHGGPYDGPDAGQQTLLTAYRQWLSCSGRVFLASAQVTGDECRQEIPAVQLQALFAQVEAALAAPALQAVSGFYQGLRQSAVANLQAGVQHADHALRDFMADVSPLARLSRLDEAGTGGRQQLQDLLAAPVDEALLRLRNGAGLVDADAGIHDGGALQMPAFHALQYADRYARLSLLPGRELNRLAGRMAGMHFARWKLHPENSARYSLLYASLRSMDGNQQWQPFGLPYARTAGTAQPENAGQRHFGYGPADGGEAGLAIFINTEARQKIFHPLFPQPLSLLETHPRLQAPNYPFPSCAENPFPVTFLNTGAAVAADRICSPLELVRH